MQVTYRLQYLPKLSLWAITRERDSMMGYAAAPMFVSRVNASVYAFQRYGVTL